MNEPRVEGDWESFESKLRDVDLGRPCSDRDQMMFACGRAAALAEFQSMHAPKVRKNPWIGQLAALAATLVLGGLIGKVYFAEQAGSASPSVANSKHVESNELWFVSASLVRQDANPIDLGRGSDRRLTADMLNLSSPPIAPAGSSGNIEDPSDQDTESSSVSDQAPPILYVGSNDPVI